MKVGRPSIWFILRHKLGVTFNVFLFFVISIGLVALGLKENFMLLTAIGVFSFMYTGFWCIDNRHRLWWRNNGQEK